MDQGWRSDSQKSRPAPAPHPGQWIAPPACIGTPYPAQLSESPNRVLLVHTCATAQTYAAQTCKLSANQSWMRYTRGKMTRLCPGYFSDEVIQILREAHLKGEWVPSLSQPCAKCGRRVPAENKAGQWVPQTHYSPQPYKSGKSGYKR
jgi:hypothetical protein